MGELICKNCVNSGIGLFNKFCSCKFGISKQQMSEFEDEKYVPKEVTFICYEGNDVLVRVENWLDENCPSYDSAAGERLEVKIEVRVRK